MEAMMTYLSGEMHLDQTHIHEKKGGAFGLVLMKCPTSHLIFHWIIAKQKNRELGIEYGLL